MPRLNTTLHGQGEEDSEVCGGQASAEAQCRAGVGLGYSCGPASFASTPLLMRLGFTCRNKTPAKKPAKKEDEVRHVYAPVHCCCSYSGALSHLIMHL